MKYSNFTELFSTEIYFKIHLLTLKELIFKNKLN